MGTVMERRNIVWGTSCRGLGAKNILASIEQSVSNNTTFVVYPYQSFLLRIFSIFVLILSSLRNRQNIYNFNDIPNPCLFGQTLFFHNLTLLPDQTAFKVSNLFEFKIFIKKIVFRCVLFSVRNVVFQTEYSKLQFLKAFPRFRNNCCVSMHPVVGYEALRQTMLARIDKAVGNKVELLYPASAYPHKNHEFLFSNFTVFQSQGIRIRLTTTRAAFSDLNLCDSINDVFTFMGPISHGQLISLLSEVDGIIFPSILESLGLPLVEGAVAKVPVIGYEHTVQQVLKSGSFYPFRSSSVSLETACRKMMKDLSGNESIIPILKVPPEKDWLVYFKNLR
jgi:hypothetical protein